MQIVTGKVRAAYPNVFQKKYNELSETEEYDMQILIPKSETHTLKKINEAIEAAKLKKWGGKPPKNLTITLRDGDNEADLPDSIKLGDENYTGHYFMKVKSISKPGVVDRRIQPILDESEFRSGDYCIVSLNSYGFEKKGGKGVTFGLNNIQVLGKGEPIGGRTRAEDDFDVIDGDDDDDGDELGF